MGRDRGRQAPRKGPQPGGTVSRAKAPETASGLFAQAGALFRARHFAAARQVCHRILLTDKTNPDAWHLLGAIAHQDRDFDEAKKLILLAIALNPANPYFRNSLGNVYRALGDFDAAAAAYRHALKLDRGIQVAHKGLAICLRALGDPQASVSQLEQLASRAPGNAEVHSELATSLRSLGRLDQACVQAHAALSLNPGLQRAQRCLAESLLLAGDYSAGWHEYMRSLTSVALPKPGHSPPPFRGKRAVVYGSEGVGDEIMAAGCLRELAAQAAECTLHTDERLVSLFQRSFPGVRCLGRKKVEGEQVLIGLPSSEDIVVLSPMLFPYLRPDPDADPVPCPYLVPDPEALSNWRARYGTLGPGLKIGLSWRGGGDPESKFCRSIPLQHWGPVLAVPGVHFVNLQYGDTAAETASTFARTGTRIHDWPDADSLRDLDAYAAQVAALDVVISVDNTTAHMAGALGIKTWTLLPAAPNWRWGLGQEETPWYATMRLLRQDKPGDWHTVLERVGNSLLDRTGPQLY